MQNESPRAPIVAMVGGGQLARMSHQAGISLGQTLRVLAVDPHDPAAQVSPDVVLGSHDDLDALRRVAAGAEALTFDHEHVPAEHLETLISEGITVAPPPSALIHAQDKLIMRQRLDSLDIPIPRFSAIESVKDVEDFCRRVDGPVVIKTVRGGYDGRGVRFAESDTEAVELAVSFLEAGVPVMVEEKVAMRRELAALVARSPFGQAAAWPVVETVQQDGICVVVVAPAQELDQDLAATAQQLALRLSEELGVVGLLAVELFETVDGQLVVNELAMRPHNSGHWTMDGAVTSQFEQHLRAVLDYPLGSTALTAKLTVMANVLGAPSTPAMTMDERLHHLFARIPDARVHLYAKAERPGRKVGHVNVTGENVDVVREKAERAARWLSHAEWTDGWDEHA